MDSTDSWIAPDGACFGCRIWAPASKPRAIVLALHGLGCREEDFLPLGEALQERGFALAAWNLRGQGLDPIVRRRGAWLEIGGMIDDLASFAKRFAESGAPLFLCGESMGALLALRAAVQEPWNSRLTGLLLFSPVAGLAQKNPGWMKVLLRVLAKAVPRLRIRPEWFVHGSSAQLQVTRIAERQAALAVAPHRLRALTLPFLVAMGDLIESAPAAAERLEVPVAVFSAGHDVFVTEAQTLEFVARIRERDKTHFHYPESYHQLMFDLDAPRVLADAAAWIEARLPRV